jgi:hypothetical protein
MARVPPLIWRLGVFWQDTLLDTATVAGRGRVALRTGAVFDVDVDRGCVILRGEGVEARLAPGGATALASGHIVVVGLDHACARAPRSFDVDTTFLHATMIGLATTICLFSALWFAPVTRFDEGGAGVPAEARRWLTLPGGAARTTGPAVFRASGRRPHEAERLLVEQRRGRPLPPRPGPGPSLQRTIELMKQALHGADGHSVRDPVGELSRAIAAAPVLGAGVGGLSPRDPVVAGPGAGVIAAGSTAQLSSVLRGRTEALEAAQPAAPRRPTYPVQLIDVPDAAVDAQRIDAAAALDPFVREQLVRAVRLRSNVLRGCYESWGLVADHLRSGRLVVELTLLPDGHVASVTTTTTTGLQAVGDCVARAAGEWYLGDGLVDEPLRLSFPFLLRPRT